MQKDASCHQHHERPGQHEIIFNLYKNDLNQEYCCLNLFASHASDPGYSLFRL